MSTENLFLKQQQQETLNNYEKVMERENKRRKRAGLFGSIGSALGGIGGGLLGLALAPALPFAAPLALAVGAGLGTTGGSLLGSRAGIELGRGRRSDATPIGMNKNVFTGEEKEFSKFIIDNYRRDVGNFQDNFNNKILSTAINSGVQAAAFAGMNPATAGNMSNKLRGVSMPTPQVVDRAAAMAYQPAGLAIAPPTLLPEAMALQAPFQGPPAPVSGVQQNNLLNMASPTSSPMSGMGPLSNRAYDQASSVSNPFIPQSITNIGNLPNNYFPVVNPESYNNAMNRASFMRELGYSLPSALGG